MPAPAVRLIEPKDLRKGQEHYAGVIRELLGYAAPELAERLSPEGTSAYLESLLFTYFTTDRPAMPLAQILFGYLPDEARPAAIPVATSGKGVVYLPNLGYAHTDRPNRPLTLLWHGSMEESILAHAFDVVPHTTSRLHRVAETLIELIHEEDPLSNSLYRGSHEDNGSGTVSVITEEKVVDLSVGLRMIAKHLPYYFDCITTVVRSVTLFHGEYPNSFASPRAHGAVFLNTSKDDNTIFFVEDLAHQCGHVAFTALTFDQERYFETSPDTPLAQFTGRHGDARTVYVTLHGLFTEAVMTQALEGCYRGGCLSPRQEHELLGRLAYVLWRFRHELKNLAFPGILSAEGRHLYDQYLGVFQATCSQLGDRLLPLDLSNQPYAFSYRHFEALNPMTPAAISVARAASRS